MTLSNLYMHWNRRHFRASRTKKAEIAFFEALQRVGSGDICLDCGANIGRFTGMMAATGAQVHAFEPDPDAFAQLSATQGQSENVTLWNAAIGTSEAEVALFQSKRHQAGSTSYTQSSSVLNESYRVADESDIRVKQIDFGAFLDGLPKPPALIKMDIEGAEVPILEMLFETGRICDIGAIYLETHEKQLPSLRTRTFSLIRRAKANSELNINFDWG